jgi:hypothetical protein
MKPTTNFAEYLVPWLMIPLLLIAGCATRSKPQPTIVGPQCSITWDKPDDSKVAGYQITVIDQSKQTMKTVKFIPADTTTVSCEDAGADHAGLWGVTVQSCYDKSTCGTPTKTAHIHITAK